MEQLNPEMKQLMMTSRLKSLLLILIFTFIASGVALALYAQVQNYNQDQVYLATQAALPVHKASKSDKQPIQGYSYELRPFSQNVNDPKYYDSALIQKDSAGNEVILVPSMKDALPEFKSNYVLSKLSFPTTGDYLYFQGILSETDAPPQSIYVFNLITKTFKKLSVSKYYSGYGASPLSPNGLRIVSTVKQPGDSNVQNLYLLDLPSDQVKVLVKLSGNETFNSCLECLGDNGGDVRWVDNNTIEYAVYDLNKTTIDQYYTNRALIEKRTLVIK